MASLGRIELMKWVITITHLGHKNAIWGMLGCVYTLTAIVQIFKKSSLYAGFGGNVLANGYVNIRTTYVPKINWIKH